MANQTLVCEAWLCLTVNKQIGDYFKKNSKTMTQGGSKSISYLGYFKCLDNTSFVKKFPVSITLSFPPLELIYFLSELLIISFLKKQMVPKY